MFWQLQYYGCSDERFGWESFGDQPDWLIFQALEFFGRQRRLEANSEAGVAAIGWSGLFSGFSAPNSQKIDPIDLLPFPDEARQQKRRVSEKTARIVAQLVISQKPPSRVVAAFCQLQEVAEMIEEFKDDYLDSIG